MILLSQSTASQIRRREKIAKLVKTAKRAANAGQYFYGKEAPSVLGNYLHDTVIDGIGVRLICTRDVGHHTGGWFKNPDYERCFHLSVSFRSPDGEQRLPQNRRIAEELARAFFHEHVRWLWIEKPFSDMGKQCDVWHYRLFADPHWQPLLPRKEVYSREFTEKGWQSFSDIHGHKPDMAMQA